MVEHMSAAQTTQPPPHQLQSFNGTRNQRWLHRNREFDSPDNNTHNHNHHQPRFSLFRWFKRRDSTSSADNRRRQFFRRAKRRPSTSSTSSSVDTFYSTATVRSFAFHSGARRVQPHDAVLTLEQRSGAVGPFAPGAVKLVEKKNHRKNDFKRIDNSSTCTLPTAFSQRQDLQTRYSLHPVNSPFVSYDSIPIVDRRPRAFAEVRRNNNNNTVTVVVDTLTSDSSLSSAKRVHVKGKRRAPDPPLVQQHIVNFHAAGGSQPASGGRRKRRPAPKPPSQTSTLSSNQDTLSGSEASGMDTFMTTKDCQTISNDTLVLRRGVLLSKKDVDSPNRSKSRTPATSICDSDTSASVISQSPKSNPKLGSMMPRQWYKRNGLNEHSSTSMTRDSSTNTRRAGGDILRGLPSPVSTLEMKPDTPSSPTSTSSTTSSSFPFEGSLSRLGFFRHHNDDKKKENKRKSGVSILTNISELDKEAAAIVQEEQARNRASMILQAAKMDEEFEKRMAANEEIVQEIVNSSMENSPRRSTRALISKFNALGNITNSNFFAKNNSASPKARAKRYSRENPIDERIDLSKYFAPTQPPPKMESASMFTEIVNNPQKPKVTSVDVKPLVAAKTNPNNDNVEFAKSLAAELDDVASGIARLRQELDERPRIDKKETKPKGESPVVVRKLSAERNRELANFDKEFHKIFDEIDKQLRTRDRRTNIKPAVNNNSNNHNITNASITSQVAKVLDILVNAEKDAVTKNSAPLKKEMKPTNLLADPTITKKDTKTIETSKTSSTTGVVRISGVDDKTTNELKEMLKEMKHSLPKAPKAKSPEKKAEISTKVSSSVQTSGNVRRIVNDTKPITENTYANVIEKRLDKEEPRVKIDLRPRGDNRLTAEKPNDSPEEGEKLEEIKKQCMNTLAVNRLLRKLEAAIASGNHQQAAGLAKELAQLKIHCSVVRQRSCNASKKLNVNMYIEDKQAHQGPIPLQLPVNMTVAQLKAKVHIEFEIPANVQRWIIGKNLADNDESTLEELQAVEGSPVFLYLVAPPDFQDKEAIKPDEPRAVDKKPVEQAKLVVDEKNDEQIHEIKAEIKAEPEVPVAAAAAPAEKEEEKVEPQARQEKDEPLTKEEKLQRYEELMSLENCDAISNAEPIECPVCFMITIPGEGVVLRDCLHSFCRICVANTVRYCEEAEVKCPYRDADYTCESTIQEREIKALVTTEVYQQHLAKSITQAENNAGNNAFHCKTPDCPGWCIYDDNVNNFLCPVCKANNCLTCQAIHMGKNCRQYQEELKYSKETDHESKRTAAMLEEMVERGEALSCPTCAVVLMKKWGCDWLRCSMCKTEICWVTRGPRWGPAGKGDTSGGCKCGENGVKCHPKCNYCH